VHDRYSDVEQVRARHILLRFAPGADDAAKQKVRAEAEDLLKQIRGGADFDALARKHSRDAGTASKGGDLGFFPRGRMTPPFDAAVFALEPGQVSEPVETQFGFHIIKLEERKAAGPRPFEAVREQIEKELTAERSLELARKQAESDHRAVVKGTPMQEAVGSRKVEETPPFAAGADIPQIGRVKAFSDEAFTLDENQVSNLIETDDAIYMLMPFDRREPTVPPLAEIRATVEADARRGAGERLAKAAAEKLLARAREVGLEKAAAEASDTVDETGSFDRRAGVVPKLGPANDVKADAFTLTADAPLGPRVYVTAGDGVVIALKSRTPADLKDLQAAETAIRDSLLAQRRQAALSSFMNHLKERAAREGALRVQADVTDRG
jgi:peptidyl-prolyl cis-trans isomerase D